MARELYARRSARSLAVVVDGEDAFGYTYLTDEWYSGSVGERRGDGRYPMLLHSREGGRLTATLLIEPELHDIQGVDARAALTNRSGRRLRYAAGVLDPRTVAPDAPRAIRRSEYETMVRLGMFEDERVELLDGMIVSVSPHGPEHDSPIERLNEHFVRAVVPRATVRVQSAFAASDGSEPEPDLAIVPRRDWSKAHPAEALLIVEVASSSLAKDRGPKAVIYARSGVPEYWVVNVVDGVVEVHTEPRRDAYARITPYRRGQRVAPAAFPEASIDVADILPSP